MVRAVGRATLFLAGLLASLTWGLAAPPPSTFAGSAGGAAVVADAGSGSQPTGGTGSSTGTGAVAGTQVVTYQSDDSIFPNPERGWYTEVAPSDYASAYADGFSLVMRYVRLDAYRNGALPGKFLDELRHELAATRGTGVKLVLRFAYNRGYGPDAPLHVVLKQIDQLGPVLREYADVIAVLQAGFIGAWGEWHDSTHDLTTPASRVAITRALLSALPTTRMVEIRSPSRADDAVPTPPDSRSAFDGSIASRVGQHNDCFLADATDAGTYLSSADRTYAQRVTTFTAMGGETCRLGGTTSRTDCPTSLEQLATYHWDYLNADYYTPVLDKWKKQGCYDEVSQRLGYRFSLTGVTAPTAVEPGVPVNIDLTLRNTGFGKLYNPRPLELVFVPVAGGHRIVLTVSTDARRLLPLAGKSTTIAVRAALPADTPAGAYDVYLRLPDASPHLSADPRYAIRLANRGTWVAADGANDLHLQIAVE